MPCSTSTVARPMAVVAPSHDVMVLSWGSKWRCGLPLCVETRGEAPLCDSTMFKRSDASCSSAEVITARSSSRRSCIAVSSCRFGG